MKKKHVYIQHLINNNVELIDMIDPYALSMGSGCHKSMDIMGSWSQEKEEFCKAIKLVNIEHPRMHWVVFKNDEIYVVLIKEKANK